MYPLKIARKKYEVFHGNQFLRFVVVGVFNTLLAYAIYALSLAVGFPYPIANFIALVFGIIISFTTQGKIVFNSLEYRRFWRFLLCWSLIYCINIAIIRELIHLGFGAYAAGALALPVIAVISFGVQKFFVFTQENAVCCSQTSFKE